MGLKVDQKVLLCKFLLGSISLTWEPLLFLRGILYFSKEEGKDHLDTV